MHYITKSISYAFPFRTGRIFCASQTTPLLSQSVSNTILGCSPPSYLVFSELPPTLEVFSNTSPPSLDRLQTSYPFIPYL